MTIRKTALRACLGTLLGASALVATPASALTIALNDIGGVTGTNADVGFRIAAKYWESIITNSGTVRIDVGYKALPTGVLGSTGPTALGILNISSYYGALAATGTSALDAQAVANLSPLSSTGSVTMVVPDFLAGTVPPSGIENTAGRLAPDGTPLSQRVALTSANVKAFTGSNNIATADSTIQFSTNFNFDFNPSDGITAGSYDFIGVAIHEIGHALGFISGADDFNYSQGNSGYNPNSDWWAYGLDMFRYAKTSFGTTLNIKPGDAAYFSLDGGATAYGGGFFSTGEDFGDGWQASHWKAPGTCTGLLGMMNPYLCNGRQTIVTGLDIAGFDAIGWNFTTGVRDNLAYSRNSQSIYAQFASSVPEPTTWAQMILGFGLMGGLMRRRKAKVAVSFG
jgi:hypothetical protein